MSTPTSLVCPEMSPGAAIRQLQHALVTCTYTCTYTHTQEEEEKDQSVAPTTNSTGMFQFAPVAQTVPNDGFTF